MPHKVMDYIENGIQVHRLCTVLKIFGHIDSLCNSILIAEKFWTKVCFFLSLQVRQLITFARLAFGALDALH
jgi:hypothetical protein